MVIHVDFKSSTTTYGNYAWTLTAFGELFVHILYQPYEMCEADGVSLLPQLKHPCGSHLSNAHIAQTS